MADVDMNAKKRFLVSLKIPVALALDVDSAEDASPEDVANELNKRVNEIVTNLAPSQSIRNLMWDLTQEMSNQAGETVLIIPGILLPENEPEVGNLVKDFCNQFAQPIDDESKESDDDEMDDEYDDDDDDDYSMDIPENS